LNFAVVFFIMAVITLTSDLGLKDFYLPAIKGYILSKVPTCNIIDISHNISPFNIAEAAFVVRNCYEEFPARTVHIINVETHHEDNEDYLLVQHKNQYFVAKNNGIISLITDSRFEKAILLNQKSRTDLLFPLRELLARAAVRIALNGNEYDLGSQIKDYKTITNLNPILEKDVIRGTILYIDNYGNAITNMNKSHIDRYFPFNKIKISFSRRNTIDKLSMLYSDVEEGEALCLYGITGLLEIAINKASASQLLGLQVKNKILVEFE